MVLDAGSQEIIGKTCFKKTSWPEDTGKRLSRMARHESQFHSSEIGEPQQQAFLRSNHHKLLNASLIKVPKTPILRIACFCKIFTHKIFL